MTLFEILQAPGLLPFEIAFGIVAGLVLLELVLSQLGLSGAGGDSDTDIDVDSGFDADAGFDTDLDTEFDLSADTADMDVDVDVDLSDGGTSVDAGGVLGWLGLGAVPSTIWLATLLTTFALLGYVLQLGMARGFDTLLSGTVASLITAPVAVVLGGRLARWIGRLIPKDESTAISTRSYGRRRGVITVGTARDGKPAQVRFTDGHGNMHYAMATPLDPADVFPQGTEVLLIRIKAGELKAVALSD